jgi:hypothetical protein
MPRTLCGTARMRGPRECLAYFLGKSPPLSLSDSGFNSWKKRDFGFGSRTSSKNQIHPFLVWFLLTGAGTSSCNPPNCVMVNIGKNLKEFWVASKHHKYPTLKLN